MVASIDKFLVDNVDDLIPSDSKFGLPELHYAMQALMENEDSTISWVNELEDQFANRMGVKYAIACNSGTSGLHAALYAANIFEGCEVIQPALTVVMDAYATIYLGGVPVFTDINSETWNIDIHEIEKKITDKTKAIIVVSLYGLPVDINPIMDLAKKHGIIVIDDSAQSVLSYYNGKIAGTLADMGVFSFENSKHMTAGSEGGMIITNNSEFAKKARKFAGIGYKNLTATAGRTSLASSVFQNPEYERFDTIGFNYRMNRISAAVALGQLERIDVLTMRRKIIGEMFLTAIECCDWLKPQFIPVNCSHSYFTFGVLYSGDIYRGINWKDFYHRYKSLGGDGFYACWKNPYLEPSLKGKIFGGVTLINGLCPIAEKYQKKLMLFKTNYRNMDVAERKINILSKMIDDIGR